MVTVRAEQPTDVDSINTVHLVSFPSDAEARLVNLLRGAGRLMVSLVATLPNDRTRTIVVGHIAFSPVFVVQDSAALAASPTVTRPGCADAREQADQGVGLAPLAVLPAHRRQGIAGELVRAGLDLCRSQGIRWVVVLGDPAYYRRFGFRPAETFGLRDEYGGGVAFQALELRARALEPSGIPARRVVRYAPEFEVVS